MPSAVKNLNVQNALLAHLCNEKAGGLQLYNLVELFLYKIIASFTSFNFSYPSSLVYVSLSLG
jgi:hypothetical protein